MRAAFRNAPKDWLEAVERRRAGRTTCLMAGRATSEVVVEVHGPDERAESRWH